MSPKHELLEHHNREAAEIVERIVTTPSALGGEFAHSLLILESVILGVGAVGDRIGYPSGPTLDRLVERIKARRSRFYPPRGIP